MNALSGCVDVRRLARIGTDLRVSYRAQSMAYVERNQSANKQLAKDQAKSRNKLFKKRSEGQKKQRPKPT